MSTGAKRIAEERNRQLLAEGWTPEHDDAYTSSELIDAALCYARLGIGEGVKPPNLWPWDDKWWKPSDDQIRNLEKAGALLAAEIDRQCRVRERKVRDDL